MEAAAFCETAWLHLKPVAQTSGFEMPVASAVYTRSSTCIFMGSYKMMMMMMMMAASTTTTTTITAVTAAAAATTTRRTVVSIGNARFCSAHSSCFPSQMLGQYQTLGHGGRFLSHSYRLLLQYQVS